MRVLFDIQVWSVTMTRFKLARLVIVKAYPLKIVFPR